MSETMPGFIEPPADMLTPPGVDPIQALLALTGEGQEGGEDDAEAKKKEEDMVRLLFKRIAKAKEAKKKWEEDYEVDRCHDYVRGFQRDPADELDLQGERKYIINKILAALKARVPALFYYFPYVRVKPARGRADSVGSQIQERSELLQDTINTIVRQPKTRFKAETMMALKEAHWAFGVIETGYDAEWGENPFAQKPSPLIENEDVRDDLEGIGLVPEEDSTEEAMSKLKEVPHAETFYTKHIPARQVYVASNDRSSTETQDWIGYWEWMYVEDVKRSFDNTEGLKANAKMAEGEGKDSDLTPIGKDDKTQDVPADMVRIWKLWDQREKKRYVIAEGHDRILKETGYYYLPLSFLRFEVMPGEWYPIPPIYMQLTEQDETNDSREWLRVVRKGTRPRYVYDKNSFPADELEKLENDDFFTMVATENGNMNPIVPVQMPQISDAVIRTLALADTSFAEQSASSPIDRQTRSAGGKPTATEVEAMGKSGDVRDSYEQQEVAEWLAQIASALIKCALEKMTLPQWILINTDPTGPNYAIETNVITQQFNQYMQLLQAQKTANAGQTLPPNEAFQGTPSGMPAPPGAPPQGQPPGPPGAPPQGQPPGAPQGQQPPGAPQGQQPQGPPSSELTNVMMQQFQEITPEELQGADDGMQWDITVDVESLSPVTEEQHGNRIMQALNLISSPGVGMLLSLSPPLLKNMLNLMGIRNASDQQNIFMALQAKTQMEQMMAMGGGGQPPGVAPQPGGGNPNKQGSGPEQPAPQGGAPAKPGGPQPNAQQG